MRDRHRGELVRTAERAQAAEPAAAARAYAALVSEIVDQLERHRLLARVRDEEDRRRMLVWLTDEGRARLTEEQEVLSLAALERAVAAMTPRARSMLLEGTRALVEAGDRAARPPSIPAARRKKP